MIGHSGEAPRSKCNGLGDGFGRPRVHLNDGLSAVDCAAKAHEDADVAKLVDARDLKSLDLRSYGFDSRRPHHSFRQGGAKE